MTTEPFADDERENAGREAETATPMVWVTWPQGAERPLVTYTMMGISLVAFALQMLSRGILGWDLPGQLGMKAAEAILAGQWWRLLTPVWLHGGLLHLAFNMYALYVLGSELERLYGHARFLGLYLLAGFAGNVFSLILSPAYSLGSSTAIFGLLAAYAVFLYRHRAFLGARGRPALTHILTIAAVNFLIGLAPGIDNWGHLGGFVGGLGFAWFAGPLFQIEVVSGDRYTMRNRVGKARVLLVSLVLFAVMTILVIGWMAGRAP